jgi:acyl carrier protein
METQINQTNSISTDKESKIATSNNLPTQVEIQDWIVNYIAELLEAKPDMIDVTIPFDRYGLDSAVAYELAGDLETWLDRELDPTLIYNYPTIETLTQQLTEELKA